MGKFTFKKEKPETGLRSIGNPYPNTIIKLDKIRVGTISAPSRFGHDEWQVQLMIKDEVEEYGWRWIFFKKRYQTELEARQFIIENSERLQEKYSLHQNDF